MKIEDGLNSDDREIAELAVNILYQQGMNIINIEELLKKTRWKVTTFDRNYINIELNWFYESMKMMEEFHKKEEQQLMWGYSTIKYGKK